MKTYLLALLTVAALALPAVAAKPSFDYMQADAAGGGVGRGDDISQQIAELAERVQKIERQVDAMRATTHSMLSELMADRQTAQAAPPQPARAAEPKPPTAPAVTYAASYVQDSGPVLQAWVEPAPSNWQQYRNAQGQLPSTSVGGQVIQASPAYSYRNAAGQVVVDYPVAISAAPAATWQRAASVPVSSYGGGACYGGACYGGRCYGGACYGGACANCR